MITTRKSNDNKTDGTIQYPMPPTEESQTTEMEIYARFMRHLRLVPNSCSVIKILSAIQFTADFLNESDAYIAKTLVDCGLRAPRKAFPAEYLSFADKSLMRHGLDAGGPSKMTKALRAHWDMIGEDKFAAHKYNMPIAEQTYFIET